MEYLPYIWVIFWGNVAKYISTYTIHGLHGLLQVIIISELPPPFQSFWGKRMFDGSVATPRIAHLDTRGAEASNEADRMMIHALIEQMPGGFDAMNSFVRETISDAWLKM